MSLVQGFIKQIESDFFPYSKAITGDIIPGVLQRYPVRTVNYADYTSALKRAKPIRDPVTKFPGMNQDHAAGHPMMNTLRKLLGQSGGPTLQKGYSRLQEDLGWRGIQRQAPVGGLDPALHGPGVADVLGAPPGLDL